MLRRESIRWNIERVVVVVVEVAIHVLEWKANDDEDDETHDFLIGSS